MVLLCSRDIIYCCICSLDICSLEIYLRITSRLIEVVQKVKMLGNNVRSSWESSLTDYRKSQFSRPTLPFLVLFSVPGSSWHRMTLCELHLFGARLVTNCERGGLVSCCGLQCSGTNRHLPTRPKEKAPREILHHAQDTTQHTICAPPNMEPTSTNPDFTHDQ